MITAAVLRNLIEGDDSNFQAAKQRTEAGLNSLKTQAQTATAGISNSFQQAGSSIGPSISAPINAAVQSVNLAGQSFQTFGAQVTTSMGGAANAAAQVPAAVGAIGASVTQMGAQVTGATQQAAQGLGGMTAATTTAATGLNTIGSSTQSVKAQLASLESTFKSNESAIVSLSTQMAANKTRIAELKDQMTTLTISGGKYTEVTNEQGRTTRVLSDQFVNLRNQSLQLGSAQGILLAKQGEYRASQGEIIQSTNKLTESGNFLVKMFATKTNMVATAGTAFMGYDRVLQTFLGSIGGVTLGVSLLITAAGFLIPKIIGSKKAHEELDGVTKELLASDILLARVFETLAHSGGTLNVTLNAQAELYRKLIQADISVLISSYVSEFKELEKEQQKAIKANEGYLKATEALGKIQAYNATVTIPELQQRTGELEFAQRSLSEATAKDSAEQGKHEKAIQGKTEALILAYKQGQITEQNLYAQATAAGANEAAINRLKSSIAGMTDVQILWNKSMDDLHIPKLDYAATSEGLAKLGGELSEQITKLSAAGKSLADIQGALNPGLHQYLDLLKQKIARDQGAAFETLNHAKAQALLMGELKKTGDLEKYLEAQKRAELNMKAFSESVKETKATLDKNSPLISERVLAGNSGDIQKAMSGVTDAIRESLRKLKSDLPTDGGDLAKSLFKGMEDEIKSGLGSSAIKSLLPDIDALGLKLKALQTEAIEGLGGGKTVREQLMEGFVKSTLEALGITGEAWAKYTAKRKAEINDFLAPLAGIYADSVNVMQQRISSSLTVLRVSFANLMHGIVDESGQKIIDNWKEVGDTMMLTDKSIVDGNKAMADSFDGVKVKVETFADVTEARIKKVKESFESILSLQVLKGDVGIFDAITTELDFLAEQSGQTSEQVQIQFRDMLSTMDTSGSGMRDVIARLDKSILASQIAKIEDTWGKSLGRAIVAMLDNLGHLESETARKVAAIGGLLSSLPDALGGRTLNKWINTVNQYINFAEKIFTTLDAFGVKLPGPLKKALDIMTGNANSTTKIMEQMKADVVRIMQEMATQVESVLQRQAAALDQNAQGWESWSARVKAANQQASQAAANTKFNPEGSGGSAGSFGGLGDLLGGLQGVFGGSDSGDGHSIGGNAAAGAGGESGKSFASGFLAKLSLITSGLTTFFGSRGQGRLAGALGGAAAGAQIGAIFGPIGAGIGAAAGALFGAIFGTGKSELQKAQEAAQLQQARDAIKISQLSVEKLQAEVQSAVADNIARMEAAMDSILGHVKIPRKQMRQYWKDYAAVMLEWKQSAQIWAGESLPHLKEAAETEAAVIGAIGQSPVAFDAIHNHVKVVERELNNFLNDYGLVITGFGLKADEIPNRIEKDAKKFAKRTKEVWGIIPEASAGAKSIFGTKLLDETDIKNWASNTEKQLQTLSDVFEHIDKAKLKITGKLAASGLDTLNFAGSAGEAIRKAIGTPSLSATDVQNLFSGIRVIFAETVKLASEIEPESQAAAKAISDAGGSVLALFKSAGEIGGSGTPAQNLLLIIEAEGAAVKQAVIIGARLHQEVGGLLTAEVVTFAKDADAVASMFGNVGKSFADAALTRDIYPATVDNIANGIELAIRGIATLRARVGSEMLSQATGAAEGINAALSVVTNAGTAFKDLGIDDKGNPRIFSIQVVDNLISITEYAVNRVATLAKSVDKGDLTAAVEFSSTTRLISTNMADGLGFIKAVAEQAPTAISSFDTMVSNVVNFDTALSRSLQVILHTRSEAAAFRAAATDTKTDVIAGLAALGNALAAATAAVPTGSSFGTQSLSQPVTLSPAATQAQGQSFSVSAPASSGNTYQFTFYGPVYSREQVQNDVMQALEALRIRGGI